MRSPQSHLPMNGWQDYRKILDLKAILLCGVFADVRSLLSYHAMQTLTVGAANGESDLISHLPSFGYHL